MKDQDKTKAQLIAELQKLRQRISELENNQAMDKQAEKALRESERRYRLLAENVTDVIWTMDLNLHSTYTSPSVRRLRGFDAEDAMSQSLEEALTPASLEIASKALEEELAKEEFPDKDLSRSRTLELEVLRKDGSTIWVETIMTFLRNADGQPTEILGITRDITERKQAEQAILESEQRTSVLSAAAFEGIVISDSGKIVDVNDQLAAMLGYAPSEMVGLTVEKFVAPESLDLVVGHVRSGSEEPYEHLALRKDGSSFPVEIRAKSLPYSGRTIRVTAVRDITGRRRVEGRLRLQSAALEAAANTIVITDIDGTIQWANPAFTKLTGFSLEEALGKKPGDLVRSGIQDEAFYMEMWDTILAGNVWHGELVNRRKDGTLYTEEMTLTPLKDEDGKVNHFIAIKQDITERMNTEQALRESEGKFRSIMEQSVDGIVLTDEGGIIIEWNQGQEKITGLKAEQTLGMPVWEAMFRTIPEEQRTPDLFERWKDGTLAFLKTGQMTWSGQVQEMEIQRSDGVRRKVQAVMFSIPTSKGYMATSISRDVSDQKSAEQTLMESQARLASIIDSAMDAIISLDDEQRIILFNPAAESLFGSSAETVIGQSIARFIPEQHRKAHQEYILNYREASYASRSMGTRGPLTCLRADGEEFLADITVSQTEMAGKKIYTAVMRDVTERERAKSLQRMLYEIASSAVTTQSLHGLYAKIHDVLKRVLPTKNFYIALYEPDKDILSFPYFQDSFDTPPPPAKPGHGLTEYVLRTQKPLHATERILDHLTKMGEIELVGPDSIEWLGVPLRAQEKVIGVMAVQSYEEKVRFSAQDLDVMTYVSTQIASAIERKQAEQALREAETRYRTLVEQIPNAVTYIDSVDPSIGTFYVSPQIETMLGFASEEWVKDPTAWHRHLYPEDRERILAADKQHDETGEPFSNEYRMVTSDNRLVWVHDEAVMLLDEAEAPLYSHGIMIDITELKRSEQTLNRRVAELSALYKTTLDIINTRNLPDLLDTIVMRAVELLDGTSGGMYLCDPEKEQALCVVSYRTSSDYTGTILPYGKGAAGTVAVTGKPLIVDNYGTWEGRAELFEKEKSFTALVSAPMLWKGQVTGVIHVLHDKGQRKFTEEDLKLLISFANQAAIAVENTRLFDETQRRLEHLSTLRHIDQAISSSLDLRVTLNVLLDHVLQQLEVDAADVLLYRHELQMLEFVAGEGFHTQALQFTTLRLGEGFAGQAVLEQRTVHISDLNLLESGFLRSPKFRNESFVVYIGVPLIAKGNVVGVLEIYNRQEFTPDREWMAFLETLAGQAAIAIDNVRMFEDLQASNMKLRQAYDATIEGWAYALETRDIETEGHNRRVVDLTVDLARKFGIDEKSLEHVRWGALLHDIGKMGIPDAIIQKPGALTEDEWDIVRQHPGFAKKWLSPILYLRNALDIPYCHHEKWDGTGYPRGLKGEQIPLAARIFAVIDVWDSLLSACPYRDAWPREDVITYIQEQSGAHFDPEVVDAFFGLLAEREE